MMKKYADRELYRLLMDLVRIPSVSPSSERENEIARFIYDTLAVLPYFRENPSDLRLLPLEGDVLKRHLVFAIVRTPRKTQDTVIVAGHMDVVSTQACGSLAPWAFEPEEYTKRIGSTDISPEARRDLETGEWLFGRGLSDMKSGVAAGLHLLMEVSRDPVSLKTNLAALIVPDEENNSAGMLSASSYLARFQEEEGLRYLACVELEPTFATGDEAKPSIYLGSIGKINPFFFCAGKETHVGEYYEGFCAAPIISHINLMLDGNPEYADSLFGKAYDESVRVLQLPYGDEAPWSDTFQVENDRGGSLAPVDRTVHGECLGFCREVRIRGLPSQMGSDCSLLRRTLRKGSRCSW